MTNPELEIVWDGGSLDLMGENDTAYGPVTIQALADGTEWGNPQSVRRALFSALADGSASALERYDNRTVVVKLRLTAADSAALAGGEAPLHMLSTKRRVELRWTPPNDFAAPAVFVVVASDLTHQMDDFAENRCRRTYALTLACLPAARSIEPVAIEALPPFVVAPDVLDDCTATTGWTSSAGVTFAVGGGGVEISAPSDGASRVITLADTFVRAKRYLAVEFELLAGSPFGGLNGTPVSYFKTTSGFHFPTLVGSEGRWAFYDLPHTLGSLLEVRFGFSTPNSGGTQVLARILTIGESDVPTASAGKQSLRVIPTPGSARADGSLLVEARDADDAGAGTPLGQVIVYTGPQYDPRLSPWRSDVATVDATALSGKNVSRTDDYFGFTAPAATFVNGSHGLWVHAKGTNGQVVNWSVVVRAIGSTSVYTGPTDALFTLATLTTTTTLVGTGYNLLNLGALDLPGFDTGQASFANLRFELSVNGTVTLDEALVFNRSIGRLTVVDTRTVRTLSEGAPGEWGQTVGATRVWLDAASLESEARVVPGRMTRGHSFPASLSTEVLSWDGAHLFTPDATFVYVGTTGALDPEVTGTFRPAWHTHPAS